jgi:hypothetical protein
MPRAAKPTVPKRSRGYYTDPETKQKLISVTTVLSNGVPKPALMHWAAVEVARCALDNVVTLAKATRTIDGTERCFQWLRNAAERKRDTAANVGSVVHSFIEATILGTPMPEVDEVSAPFLEQFRRFVIDFDVEFTASEAVVANRSAGWAGTLDWMAHLRAYPDLGHVMGDTKTGGDLASGKGVYPEAGLQMSAYRQAEVLWLRDGSTVPMPATDSAVVLHLRPDGYRVVPVRADEWMYAAFLAAKAVATYVRDLAPDVVADPMPVPAAPVAEAVAV